MSTNNNNNENPYLSHLNTNQNSHKKLKILNKSYNFKKWKQPIDPIQNTKKSAPVYIYGNYPSYYTKRNKQGGKDPRLDILDREFFIDKDVLDIGCNSGRLTTELAYLYNPKKITGVDIDENLIGKAISYLSLKWSTLNLNQYNTEIQNSNIEDDYFPISMPLLHGYIPRPTESQPNQFPLNTKFLQCDIMTYDFPKKSFNTILALSVTKWIHLNYGDKGLKDLFYEMHKWLKEGGSLILEPQPWPSYESKKNLTDTIRNNYHEITFYPNEFKTFLLEQVGFNECIDMNNKEIDAVKNLEFNRPLWVFIK